MLLRAALSLVLAAAAVNGARAQASLFQQSPMTRIESAPAGPRMIPLTATPAQALPAPARAKDEAARPSAAPEPAKPDAASSGVQKPAAELPAAPRPTQVAQPQAKAASASTLRHLHNNAQGYRLAGEIGASEWPIYLTAAQAAAPLRFQLGYLSAVSVMPEASTLKIEINDVAIATAAIKAPHSVSILSFDVPADAVKPGFNALRISVQQRHRVDCSLQATYELWTQIDPSQTGFVFAGDDPGVVAIEDLPALAPNPQGGLPVRALLGEQTELASIDRMLRAVQAIAINGRFEQVLVDVDAGVGGEPYGVNIAVGPFQQIRNLAGLETLRQPDGPALIVLPAQSGARPTIVATGNTGDDVDAALDRLTRAVNLRGAAQGLRAAAAFPGLRIDGGRRVSLKDFGVSSQEFSGRMFRTGFHVIMPSDFYAADYAKVQINLAGGYAAGLTNEAQIVVSVNDRNVIGVKLPKSGGEVFKDRSIPIPLSALRPGLNRIDIEAHVPTQADRACDPLAALGKAQRFLLLDTTELVLPDVARIARLPDLAVTATGAFPYAAASASRLYMPKPDRESIAAAATLVARLAISGGQLIDFRTTTQRPAGSGATLAVAPAAALDPAIVAASGVDVDLLRAAWSSWSDNGLSALRDASSSRFETLARYNLALQRNFPAECRMRSPLTRVAKAEDAEPAKPKTTEALYESWRQTQRDSSQVYAFGRASLEWFGERLRIFRRMTAALVRRLAPEAVDDDQSRIVRPNMSLLLSQANLGGEADGVWTLVTAPNSTALLETMNCAVDPRVWAQMRGRMSALDSSEARVAALRASDLDFVGTQPFSVQNARLIAAGWFSTNRWTYTSIILAIAVLLGSATFWLVRNVGRRQP